MLRGMLTRWLDKHGFWAHWQNLNERPGTGWKAGEPYTPPLVGWPYHGRCWLHARPEAFTGAMQLGFSWNLWTHFCHVGVHVHQSSDDDFNFSIAFPPVAFWFSISSHWTRRLAKWLISLEPGDMGTSYAGRELEIGVHHNALWWDLWVDDTGWTSSRPKWRDGSWYPLDTFLGKTKYEERVLEERDITVHMPEKGYAGSIRMLEATWKRPRWFPKRMVTADIKMKEPIPFPGKGENSYDCGMDAAHGMSMPARNVSEAVGRFIGSVLHDRERYGGRGWKLEDDVHAERSA